MTTITLCHKPGRCCPTVYVGESVVTFKNDEGEKCSISREQFDILKSKIKNNEL